MPRRSQSLPRYRHHKASGQAVVTLDGQDFYLGPYNSRPSRREYDRLVGQWQANGRRLPPPGPSDVSLSELLAGYWRFAKTYYVRHGEPTSELQGIQAALRFVRRLYRDQMVHDFGPLALDAVRASMVEAGHSRAYVNKNVGRIKRMFKWGVARELVPVTIYQALCAVEGLRRGRTTAYETRPVEPVDDAVVDQTLPHLSPVVADMVRFQRLTGCRPGEVCLIRPVDVDRSGSVWRYVPEKHKTEHHGRQRVIFIGPEAQAVLSPYLLRDVGTYCFSPVESEEKRRAAVHAQRKTPLSWGNRPGTNRRPRPARPPRDRYDTSSYHRAVIYACLKAFPPPAPLARREKETLAAWRARLTRRQHEELKQWNAEHRWSPNQLRHAAATRIRRRYGLEAAQVILGHSRADVTQIYAERDLAKAAEIMEQVG